VFIPGIPHGTPKGKSVDILERPPLVIADEANSVRQHTAVKMTTNCVVNIQGVMGATNPPRVVVEVGMRCRLRRNTLKTGTIHAIHISSLCRQDLLPVRLILRCAGAKVTLGVGIIVDGNEIQVLIHVFSF